MVKKSGKGYKVVSEKGKNLGSKTKSGKPLTKAQAHKRLAQVEWFKAHKGKQGIPER
jgi:hypothetical protein